jgi:hypothetical protein
VTDLAFSDSVHVALAPERVYALVSDVTRMGEWSPVCKACWWEDDSQGGPAVGAWFVGRNETPERTWETRSQVVVADAGREFAWEVNGGWVRWGFTMAPEDGSEGRSEATGDIRQGTRLTESWAFLPRGIAGFHERYADTAETEIAKRSDAAKAGIPATLAAIKKTAEAG